VREEKSINGAVKDDNFDLLISLERRDDLVQLRMVSGPKMFEGGWSNVTLHTWATPRKTNLPGSFCP